MTDIEALNEARMIQLCEIAKERGRADEWSLTTLPSTLKGLFREWIEHAAPGDPSKRVLEAQLWPYFRTRRARRRVLAAMIEWHKPNYVAP